MERTLESIKRTRREAKMFSTPVSKNITEAYSLCFYYYNMFENVSNYTLMEQYKEIIMNFLSDCEKMGKTERLAKVLKAELQNLEKKNLLTPYKNSPVDEDMEFSDSEIRYYYEQDKRIDRKMPSRVAVTENLVNIFRILFVTEVPVFSSIINTVVFSDDENLELKKDISLTKELKKLVYDFSKTQFLVQQVNLSEAEARYILFKSRLGATKKFCIFFDEEFENEKAAGKCISTIIGVPYSDYRTILRDDGKIRSFGFVDAGGDYNSSLDECIDEQSIYPYFADLIKPLDCSNAYSLDSFSVKQESIEVSVDLLKGKNPVSILFYGKPGAGKTELAKAIGKETGQKVYIFKNEKEVNGNRNILGRLACLLSMEWKDSVLVVDEADTLLKTVERGFFGMVMPTAAKGMINKMLENNRDKVIYIINHQGQIDESTRRRFTFSIKFESMPASILRSIAKTRLSHMTLEEDVKEELLQMLNKYHLSGASVDNLEKTIESINYSTKSELLKKAEIVMKENALLLNGKTKMRETVKAEYDPKVLNASMSPCKIVEMVQNAAQFAEKNKGTESGIRMLFYGLSGTGKTELARYIAEQLGKPILLKRASDILDCYVGGSEQNIRDAFMEAENSDSILLFDEADSFFCNREQAQHSWERTQVNEFLTQMEEFSGVLICTTNLRNVMDPAMQRRFHMMVEFKPMKFDGIKIMADRYFPAYHLSNSQIESLEDMESVTPGDFGALSSRIRFMNPDDVNSDYILGELKKLQQEKKNQWNKENGESEHRIGFTA